jgi:hypothetical protein
MIKTQFVEENGNPIAVIMDYEEYLKLKELEEDREDYNSAYSVKSTNIKWTSHQDLKDKLGL